MVLENIFIDEDYNLFREILKVLEYNVFNYNHDYGLEDENDGNYFFNNNNNSFYESLEYTNLSNDNQSEDENYEYVLNKYNKNKNKYVEDFEKLKNEFYFFINLIPKKNIIYSQTKIQTILANKINYYLSINKDNIIITCNNEINFMDTFITTSKFMRCQMKVLKIISKN